MQQIKGRNCSHCLRMHMVSEEYFHNVYALGLVSSLTHQKNTAQIICPSYLIQFVCTLHSLLSVSQKAISGKIKL